MAPFQFPDDAAVDGFTAATVIPAIASTLKQAQREAAEPLHTIASYAMRARASEQAGRPLPPLRPAEREAAHRVGQVMLEQAINGTTFFLAVKAALIFGVWGGALAQVAITANTVITPHQTQSFNPARRILGLIEACGDWVGLLGEDGLLRGFACRIGLLALACGYGEGTRPQGDGPPALGSGAAAKRARSRKPEPALIYARVPPSGGTSR